tara:strand:- start:1353 stop:2264 length:912 start_codon:yes stop_codon:yes gene_type:complete
MQKIDVADLDCIYLSYDEPQKEEFWVKIQNIVPWAKRVDGVEGSDAAHKAAAEASDTERFILIDGDNLPYPEFFDITLNIEDKYSDCVFRWKAVNEINGLMYGNGGLSCWTKTFIQNMRTHEHSDGSDDTAVEFCYDPKYLAMNNVYSKTYPNGSAKHAWRAGFREGVKMCLRNGTRPTLTEFEDMVHRSNFDRLSIWHNLGADVEHGRIAMNGARFGTYKTMLTDWDFTEVQWFDNLERMYEEYDELEMPEVNGALMARLSLPMLNLDNNASKFFKKYYAQTYCPAEPMSLEIDTIRKHEGW